jgi:hypothetical protein
MIADAVGLKFALTYDRLSLELAFRLLGPHGEWIAIQKPYRLVQRNGYYWVRCQQSRVLKRLKRPTNPNN